VDELRSQQVRDQLEGKYIAIFDIEAVEGKRRLTRRREDEEVRS